MAFPGPVPIAPNSGDPGNFNSRADTFLGWMALFAAWLDEEGYPDFSQGIKSIAGTAAAPAITFTDDLDSGMFSAGANILGFAVGGSERLRLTTSGAQIGGILSGTAVIQSQTDLTAGRLLTTSAGPAQVFRRGNIIGTVSQASGVPTGAIMEPGENANGFYVRFADGTQICWGSVVSDVDGVQAASGSIFTSANNTNVTFAMPFVSTPVVSCSIIAPLRWVNVATASSTSAGIKQWAPSSNTSRPTIQILAIGRWF